MLSRISILVLLVAVAAGCASNSSGSAPEAEPTSDALDAGENQTGDADGGDEPELADTVDTVDTADSADGADGGADGGPDADGGDPRDDVDGSEPEPEPEPPVGWSASEMAVFIQAPSSAAAVSVSESPMIIEGSLFGDADALGWVHQELGSFGSIDPAAVWSTGAIDLVAGDNTLQVIASDSAAGTQVTDTVVVTYTPGVSFGATPSVVPRVMHLGDSYPVWFRALLSNPDQVEPGSVELWTAAISGSEAFEIGELFDDGDLAGHCDEVSGDGVYSTCFPLTADSPGEIQFRVRATPLGGAESEFVESSTFAIDVVDPISAETCTAQTGVLAAARQVYEDALSGENYEAAQNSAMASLQQSPLVSKVGPATDGGYGVWVQFANSTVGAIGLGPTGSRGSTAPPLMSVQSESLAAVQSKAVALFHPIASESARLGVVDEVTYAQSMLGETVCPYHDTSVVSDELADLRALVDGMRSGVFIASGHGEALFAQLPEANRTPLDWAPTISQEVFWTGQPLDCTQLDAIGIGGGCVELGKPCAGGLGTCTRVGPESRCTSTHHADLRRGRLVFTDTTYAVTPSYLSFHLRLNRVSHSLAYLGACRSLFNGGFATALWAAGAAAIAGYTESVDGEVAAEAGTAFLAAVLSENGTVGDAPEPAEDVPFAVYGMSNVAGSVRGLVNGSFEVGDSAGWTIQGDTDTPEAFGNNKPTDGARLGVLRAGVGYYSTAGALSQTFCADSETTGIRFDWGYVGEHFLSFCGSDIPDGLLVTLSDGTETQTLLDAEVDDLCPAAECSDCGGEDEGFKASGLGFGGQAPTVFSAPFRLEDDSLTVDVSGPLTLEVVAKKESLFALSAAALLDDFELLEGRTTVDPECVGVADGEPCIGANPCELIRTCNAGECESSPAIDCDDGDSCTVDICSEVGGGTCTNTLAGDGTPCSDGDPCTGGDTCQAGTCEPGAAASVPGCADPFPLEGLLCALSGVAGDTVDCPLQFAAATAETAPLSGIQFALEFNANHLGFVGNFGELCTSESSCFEYSIPPASVGNGFNLAMAGVDEVAAEPCPPNPALCPVESSCVNGTCVGTGGSLTYVVVNFFAPTSPMTDAVVSPDGSIAGDPVFVTIRFELLGDVASGSPDGHVQIQTLGLPMPAEIVDGVIVYGP